jgi:hypothetical protein
MNGSHNFDNFPNISIKVNYNDGFIQIIKGEYGLYEDEPKYYGFDYEMSFYIKNDDICFEIIGGGKNTYYLEQVEYIKNIVEVYIGTETAVISLKQKDFVLFITYLMPHLDKEYQSGGALYENVRQFYNKNRLYCFCYNHNFTMTCLYPHTCGDNDDCFELIKNFIDDEFVSRQYDYKICLDFRKGIEYQVICNNENQVRCVKKQIDQYLHHYTFSRRDGKGVKRNSTQDIMNRNDVYLFVTELILFLEKPDE